MPLEDKYIVWFKEVDKDDGNLVGGKGANLGEMVRNKFPVPNGFIVTSTAYYAFLKENNLETKINHLLNTIKLSDSNELTGTSRLIKKLILKGKMSEKLTKDIFAAYKKLGGVLTDALVAVRSSATAEDLPGASFAGQQETYLNVKGEANLILKIKEAWASLFDSRAIFYRHEKKFDHFKVGIAIPVQKMVESEKSGVLFSVDPVTQNKNTVVIEAIYGLGELIVQGAETPDHYEFDKKSNTIIQKTLSLQHKMLKKVGMNNKKLSVPKKIASKQKISDEQIKYLAELSMKLEKHYYFPQDSEWAIEKGKIYLVQTRPITTLSVKDKKETETVIHAEVILRGAPASPGIASGPVKILRNAKEIQKVLSGDILVAPQTNPDFVPAMKKAVGIITDYGGRTSHAAIVSREIGIPAVVGTEKATQVLKEGMVVTINGKTGDIFKGGITGTKNTINVEESFAKTATKIYVNLAEPDFAQKIAQRNIDGVGLLRAEFMMAEIGVHPKKMIRDGKKKEYIQKLSEGLEQFCKVFTPRPVIYRASDFKTNEYRNLIGGKLFEPLEPNPMLGYRGVYRYIHDPQVFELELEAIKRVRNKMGLKNLWLMLPFVRTVHELEEVKKLISLAGLYRSPTFKLWMMVEIPSNVILLEQFIQTGIDGVSIGSNDLTMLILGTDRDNSEVSQEFDEQNDAVLWAFERVIKISQKHKITVSLCGQAASEYPDLLEKLIRWGITSVSVSPDVITATRTHVAEIEKKLLS